jgi:hypothetical protein
LNLCWFPAKAQVNQFSIYRADIDVHSAVSVEGNRSDAPAALAQVKTIGDFVRDLDCSNRRRWHLFVLQDLSSTSLTFLPLPLPSSVRQSSRRGAAPKPSRGFRRAIIHILNSGKDVNNSMAERNRKIDTAPERMIQKPKSTQGF